MLTIVVQKSVEESEDKASELQGAVSELQKLLREAAQGTQSYMFMFSNEENMSRFIKESF